LTHVIRLHIRMQL